MSHAFSRCADSNSVKFLNLIGACAARVLRTLSIWQHRQKSRNILATLDDRMLRDIGLTRVDMWRETMKPFWKE